jgi:serine/threonine-protein kinase HipA
MATSALNVYMDTAYAGTLLLRDGRTTLEYDPDYDLAPVSMSMSHLDGLVFKDKVVKPYLQGLLPDNDLTLLSWRKRFRIRSEHPFALLSEVGQECAGAISFLDPSLTPAVYGGVVPLSHADIEALIVGLKSDPAGTLNPGVTTGQFSLAGAQSKFSLLRLDNGGWARATGTFPSTHIVKPALGEQGQEFRGKELNEHVCMTLARACGLTVPLSQFLSFGDEVAIVVSRYDRIPAQDGTPDLYHRVHQEDLCQALGVAPAAKYDPGVPHIAQLFRRLPAEDRVAVATAFGQALMYNWLIGGTDAHAKNYSLLHTVSSTRLAPLYDLISFVPYRASGPVLSRRPGEGDRTRVRLAMAVNGVSYAQQVTGRDWLAVERALGLEEESLLLFGSDLARRIIDELPTVLESVRSEGWSHDVLDGLEKQLPDYVAGRCHDLTVRGRRHG